MHMTRNLTLEDFYLLNQLHSAAPDTPVDTDNDLEDEEEDDEDPEEDEDGEDEQDDVDDTDANAT